MAPTTTTTTYSYQPGKPPLLVDSSSAGLLAFARAAKLFLRAKKVEDEEDKVAYVGAGLAGFPELYNWYLSSAAEHESKTYASFLSDLQRRALPRDYVWEAKGRLRSSRQGNEDYEDWVDLMRSEHLTLTTNILSTREFVEYLLYGMDDELSSVLRRGQVLKNSGFHQDDLATAALSTTPLAFTAPIDYDKFDREARDEWSKIAFRRRSNTEQIKALNRKNGGSSTIGNSRGSSSGTGRATPLHKPVTSVTTSETSTVGTGLPPLSKLTELERDWLSATKGCFKCRTSYVDHEGRDCKTWAPRGHVVPVPVGWNKDKPVPSSATSNNVGSMVAALHLSEVDVPGSFADDSDTDSDGCAFPPLPLVFTSKRRSRRVLGLTDSGSSVTLIADKLASELGLERFRLSRPKRVRVAIQGGEDSFLISEFIRAPVSLENGSWSSPVTTLLIAPLSEPFKVILGVPFLKANRLSLVSYPEPQILVERETGLDPFDLLADVQGPATAFDTLKNSDENSSNIAELVSEIASSCAATLVEKVETESKERMDMKERAERIMRDFDDLFLSVLPPLAADALERAKARHRIRLLDDTKVHNQRGFSVPRKWREAWKRMLEEHIAAGRLRPSTSPFASAAFVVPKKDPLADPRWDNDYRGINSNTVKDRTPLPLTDEVLADAALARFWGKIDMTNAFFQTLMDPADIEKTAIKTPWGLFEWTVMPQAFVDDVIIYSNTIEEHEANCRAVLTALWEAGLFCSRKKTDLFTLRTEFLGHVISREGLEASSEKTDKVKNWPRPKTVTQVRGFLGVVQYLRKFIPDLAKFTSTLTPLTKKGTTRIEHLWTEKEERAFESIKKIVTSLPVLKPLNQASAEKIWLMTDASKVGIGAVLLQGDDWKTASPCGFYSRQYIPAEKNYPTHEQELLAIVAALRAWRVDLLGVPFTVLTNHDTLKHFRTQQTLSKRQARWTGVLADYDYSLEYVPGPQNTVADALSRFSFAHDEAALAVCGISSVSLSKEVITRIKGGYADDPFIVQVLRNLPSTPSFSLVDGLHYHEGARLVVPKDKTLRETLLHDAHDALGHLGPRKTATALSASFYWSGMAKDVELYCSSCDGCQRFKARTTRRAGKLHSLPVPSRAFSDVALDFAGPIPLSEGKDMMLTMTDRLTGYTRILPCRSKDGAREIAELVYRGWFCLFGLPQRLVSDRDKLFTSKFWRTLHKRVGLHLQMSTSFHPETDGRSERTNKTVVQILRQYVSRQQQDWVSHLSSVEFSVNAAVNDSTGKSPFELVLGFTPSLAPNSPSPSSPVPAVESVLERRQLILQEARDSLAAAKVRQAEQANRKRGEDPSFFEGDLVMVDSADRRSRYKTRGGDVRASKLFPRWDGPYEILRAFVDTSTFELQLPPADRAHPVFHSSKLKPYRANDPALFPSRTPPRPDPIDVDGEAEYMIEKVVDERLFRHKREYMVKWEGYPDEDNSWEPREALEDTVALQEWEDGKRERGLNDDGVVEGGRGGV
ncbi:hypothetical protein JCM11641_001892 [Rhodosporidiobolus odoratus]